MFFIRKKGWKLNKTNIECDYKNYEWLKFQYERTKSMYSIAAMCGCSYRTIHVWLVKFGIERTGRDGYKHSEETKEKILKGRKGKTPMLGKCHSTQTKLLMSQTRTGEGNSNWKGGTTVVIRKFRHSKEYQQWKKKVIEGASGYCQCCKKKLPLEAHHKISLKTDFSLALSIENGIALCHNCHLEADRRNKNEQAS